MTSALPIYDFDHVHACSPAELRQRIGGKGAGLVEMRQQLQLPVPPGFVLGTALCQDFLRDGWPAGLDAAIEQQLARLEQATGQRFGSEQRPLLVSVRSGAPVSMPGMMDTILNLGANEETIAALGRRTGDKRFALDTWSRFLRMYAITVLAISREALGDNPASDASADVLLADVETVRALCARQGQPIPDDPCEQLRGAIAAVFRSSRSERAKVYREREGLADDIPTAVVVQAMVFGNMGASSGTGVAFTRNPSTGSAECFGDFLPNAQGEDVVAGTRTSEPLGAMAAHLPDAWRELNDHMRRLEQHYHDLCDIEFTVQEGRLHILQVRAGKRSAIAAVRIAVAMANEGLIARDEAVRRVTREQLKQLAAMGRVRSGARPIASGVAASPGVASGVICLEPHRVPALADAGQKVILVRPTTSPEDVHGMVCAAGIVTSTGGMVSHAALVARGWGIAAVCGVESLRFAPLAIGEVALREGDVITIDGDTGRVFVGACLEASHEEPAELRTLRQWAQELGLELGGGDTHAARAGSTAVTTAAGSPAIDAFCVMRALALLGFASRERLAVSVATSADVIGAIIDALPDDFVGQAPRGLHATPDGRAWLQTRLEAERADVDQAAANATYDRFMLRDAAFKQLVTDWQVRLVDGRKTLNDHGDAAYDGAVRERLAAFHVDTRGVIADAVALAERLAPYPTRLARAAAAVASGDGSMIASPLKDSYHTVWFELHEELIHLSGRNRADVEAVHRKE